MCALQLDNAVVGDVQKNPGLNGAAARLWPRKLRYVASIIFMELSDEWVEWPTKEYGQTPYFALMAYSEYSGEELRECELVAEVYSGKAHQGEEGQSPLVPPGGSPDRAIGLQAAGQAL